MILEFTVKNFRSIENQTFTLTTSNKIKEFPNNVRTIHNTDILTSCILYGRNASGKSNLLNALSSFIFFINNSDKLKHSEEIVYFQPFLFDSLLKNKPTEFQITFITSENLKFKYEVSFDNKQILFEALYYFSSNKPSKLFIRELNKPISYGEHYTGSRKIIEDNLLPNQLFLSKSATSNIRYLKEAYLFFLFQINFHVFHKDDIDSFFTNIFAKDILDKENKYFAENLNNLLNSGDVNITNFIVEKTEPYVINNEKDKIIFKQENNPLIKTYHKLFEGDKEIGTNSIKLEQESLGTQRLFLIGAFIINALSNGATIIIDELDKGLHPLLTKLLIKLFHSEKTNPNKAQLIFASHDTSLLDNELFRRDQIYFVEKDYSGKTELYRLSDIKGVRKDVPYDKWYLSGRFNAIPIIDDLELKF